MAEFSGPARPRQFFAMGCRRKQTPDRVPGSLRTKFPPFSATQQKSLPSPNPVGKYEYRLPLGGEQPHFFWENEMIRWVATLAIAAVFGLASCTQPPEKPAGNKSSVLGVSLQTQWGFPGIAENPDAVYFIRLGGTDRVKGYFPLLRSNFRQANQYYLLNAPPGRYAAVAASRMNTVPITQVNYMGLFGPSQFFTTYFPEPMIRQTIVEVTPGGFAFMGIYSVRKDVDIYSGDETQAHYRGLIEPTLKDPYFPLQVTRDVNSFSHRGSVLTADQGPQAEATFLSAAVKALENSGWEGLLQKRLEALPAR